ncbi:MAG: F0F1 ATP synthase subunit epsilon [Bacteroidetes bacterium]|nr:F0F1 ATP synthase subunit epsilon [Bacteroidota bacterium]
MQLEILTPEHQVFNGNVYGIYLPGVEGTFELLDMHAPLIASLGKGKMKVLKEKTGQTDVFEISGGFVEMLNNKATVLIEDATSME